MSTKILDFVSGLTFSDLGSIASIVSLVVTIFVFKTVKELRSYYMFIARVPELLEQLQEQSSKIANYMNGFDGFRQDILIELNRSEVVLSSLQEKVDGRSRESVEKLLNTLESYNSYSVDELDRDDVFAVYVDMIKVADEIKGVQEDLKWEK